MTYEMMFISFIIIIGIFVAILFITDYWINVKDVCYRIEKWMHLKNYESNRSMATFMKILRHIARYK